MLNEIAKRHFARLNSKKFHLDSFFLTENRPHKIFESEASVSTESKKVLLLCQIWFSVKKKKQTALTSTSHDCTEVQASSAVSLRHWHVHTLISLFLLIAFSWGCKSFLGDASNLHVNSETPALVSQTSFLKVKPLF